MYGIIHHSKLRALKNPPTKINWPLFSGVILILFASFINSSALFISMVDIKINLQLNFVEMTWISIVYLTFVTGFIGVAGQYGDMYGHIKLFMVGSLIYLICCIILSACTNVAMLMVGRAIQGLGVAFLVANSLSIIRMCAPSNQVPRLMKIWVITLFSAYSLGCILGALMSSVNWRINYWIMFAFVLPGLYLVWKNRLAANDEFEKKPIDYLGTLLILLSIILLVLLFTTPAIWGWHSPAVITFIAVTPILFIAFLVREKIADFPLVPLSIFKNMDFSLGVIQIFSCFFGFYVNATQAPWRAHYQMYDYVLKELPALVEKEFPVTDKKAIAGHSMGGHGALVLALRNSDQYSSVSAFSPICHPSACAWGKKAFTAYLGPDELHWLSYDACELLKDANQTLPLLIDQGSADEFYPQQLLTEDFQEAAKQASYSIECRFHDGYDHSYYFISSLIGDHINFHAQHLYA